MPDDIVAELRSVIADAEMHVATLKRLRGERDGARRQRDALRAVAKRLYDGWVPVCGWIGGEWVDFCWAHYDDNGAPDRAREPMTPAEIRAVNELAADGEHFPTEGDDAEQGTDDG